MSNPEPDFMTRAVALRMERHCWLLGYDTAIVDMQPRGFGLHVSAADATFRTPSAVHDWLRDHPVGGSAAHQTHNYSLMKLREGEDG